MNTPPAQDARARARRWFRVSAALWLLLPVDAAALGSSGVGRANWATIIAIVLDIVLLVVPLASASIWGARLASDEPRLRSGMLTRAIASANLLFALLYAVSVGGIFGAAFSSLLAFASARILALLGDRGLGDCEDPGAELDPIRFRGLLIAALTIAFADVLILGFSTAVLGVRTLGVALAGLDASSLTSTLLLTGAATLVMVVNVWGLARLRVWALFGTMLCHLAIAELAIQGLLATNLYVSLALAVLAVGQLLVPIPILAAAIGDRQGRSPARLGELQRWLVAALVVITVVMAARNFGPALPDAWLSSRWPG
jgi:hypothetical protein